MVAMCRQIESINMQAPRKREKTTNYLQRIKSEVTALLEREQVSQNYQSDTKELLREMVDSIRELPIPPAADVQETNRSNPNIQSKNIGNSFSRLKARFSRNAEKHLFKQQIKALEKELLPGLKIKNKDSKNGTFDVVLSGHDATYKVDLNAKEEERVTDPTTNEKHSIDVLVTAKNTIGLK